MYSCFVHLLYLYRLSWANVIKWKGSLRSPSLFTPDLIVVVLSIYIRRELMRSQANCMALTRTTSANSQHDRQTLT